MHPGDPRPGPVPQRRPATMLESVEEIRAQVRRAQTVHERPPTAPAPAVMTEPAEDAQPFRPSQRPSMALLRVLDDGDDDDGETIRIRAATFVIGRVEGNLVIPHDGGMSGRHVEISRRLEDGQHRWHLKDLGSTNGTFVRAANGLLHHGQEILLGARRYRFDASQAAELETHAVAASAEAATRKWQALAPEKVAELSAPSLVELTPQGEGRRFRLGAAEHWVGRDARQCAIVLDDPMVSPKHVRIYRDPKARWIIQNAKSLNGLWLRVTEIPLDRGGQFQCGEQRFLIKIL